MAARQKAQSAVAVAMIPSVVAPSAPPLRRTVPVRPDPAPRPVRPVRAGTVSACLIVRNEEQMLPDCLQSLREAVDELIVVDTGSTDGTKAIAVAAGATVLEHPWHDDFAEARNVSLEAASGEWVLIIDADERLRRADGQSLRRGELLSLLRAGGGDVYDVWKVNYSDRQGKAVADWSLERRIARRHPLLAYSGRIHEQMVGPAGYRVKQLSAIRLHHFGYTPEAWTSKGKRQRNIGLLQKMLDEQPGAPHLHFFLGREYAQINDFPQALRHFQQAIQGLNGTQPPYWFDLVLYWVDCLLRAGRLQDAIAQCDVVLRSWPAFAEIWTVKGRCLLAQGKAQEALEPLLKAIAVHGRDERILARIPKTPALAWLHLGEAYARLGEPSSALAAYRESLRAYPALGGAVRRILPLALAAGESPTAVEAWIAEAVSSEALDSLAEEFSSAYSSLGRWAEALPWAERAAATGLGRPGMARERLAVTLLHLGRWGEATEAFARAEAEAGAAPGPDAAWARVLAALAAGRPEAARAAARHLSSRSEPQVRAVRRWLQVEGAEDAPPEAEHARGLLQLAEQLLAVGAARAAQEATAEALRAMDGCQAPEPAARPPAPAPGPWPKPAAEAAAACVTPAAEGGIARGYAAS